MKVFLSIILLLTLQSYLFAGNRIPIPAKQIPYNKSDVITNPINGEKFVHNQLLVVFEPIISVQQQNEILESIDGKVVGGSPGFDIYQIAFENPEKSFSKLAQVQLQLEKNKHIVYAMPQNVDEQLVDKNRKLIASVSSQRTGQLMTENYRRKFSSRYSNEIQNTINRHWTDLNTCVEQLNQIVDSYHGKIKFKITVAPEGDVKYARVFETNIRNKQLTICMLQKIRRWEDFPKIRGSENRQVEFEFVF
ncbi:AgmX/PglI C-terminal domain-containing protein [Calditrichota bacterium]